MWIHDTYHRWRMVAMTLCSLCDIFFDGCMRPIARVPWCQLYYSAAYHILRPAIWCPMMIVHIHCKLSRSSSAFQFAYHLCLRAVPFGHVMTRLWVADVKVECLLFYICPCVMRWLSSLTRPSRCDILYPPTPRVAYYSSAGCLPLHWVLPLRPASSAGDLRHPLD